MKVLGPMKTHLRRKCRDAEISQLLAHPCCATLFIEFCVLKP
jgi:hypothetical protein